MRPHLLALLIIIGLAPLGVAQSERYELGARLKAFEAEWDRQTNKDARKRALKDLPQVTTKLFSFQYGKAAQTLDEARYALLSDQPPSDAVRWATSLYPEVKLRLTSEAEVPITVKQLYSVKAERPKSVSVRASFDGKTWTTAEVEKLPVKLSVPVPPKEEGRHVHTRTLTVQVVVDDKPLATRNVLVGVINLPEAVRTDSNDYFEGLQSFGPPSLELATWRDMNGLLESLLNGAVPESDMYYGSLVNRIRTLRERVIGKGNFFTHDRPGDFSISIPTGEMGKTVTPCRLFVPEKLDAKKPVPLVVAMHGAGGSENLFFEGYGNGHIVKLCKERGWLLVSPRASLGFGLTPAPPVGDIVDELAKRYPVDVKRVFILGHSMGSSMAFDAVQKYPGKFAAVACLGGGGKVRQPEVFAELPVFIGVGGQDFALKTAKALNTALTTAKAKKVTYKEYPDVEHLVIVREALGDVFDLFDKVK